MVEIHFETEEKLKWKKGEMANLPAIQGFWLFNSKCRARQRQMTVNENILDSNRLLKRCGDDFSSSITVSLFQLLQAF